jgi:Zn-dependent peptidase ImmA (M78 family)
MTRQKWLERELVALGHEKNPLIGLGKNIHSPLALANIIKAKLEIDIKDIREIKGEDGGRKKALHYLIERAENQGIFVGKTISYHDLDVEDMRGLSISNDYCPFVVINRRDALSAQIFSFIHELAHLFRKSDAISNTLDFRTTNNKADSEEVFCNQVAAELLLPKEDFLQAQYAKNDIDQISIEYKVSPLFIFYRLKELGKIPKEFADGLEREIRAETDRNLVLKKAKDKRKKGGSHTNSMRDSNGALFNKVVSRSYLENKIGYVEASNLLRFSVEKV